MPPPPPPPLTRARAPLDLPRYDPMALIVTVPALRELFFQSKRRSVLGVDHHVVGLSKIDHGVREFAPLHKFMLNGFFQGLTIDLLAAEDAVILVDPVYDTDVEMTLALLRNIVERRLVNCRAVVCRHPGNGPSAHAKVQQIRETLDLLGMSNIPLGIGPVSSGVVEAMGEGMLEKVDHDAAVAASAAAVEAAAKEAKEDKPETKTFPVTSSVRGREREIRKVVEC